jgi:hypothetical protein
MLENVNVAANNANLLLQLKWHSQLQPKERASPSELALEKQIQSYSGLQFFFFV